MMEWDPLHGSVSRSRIRFVLMAMEYKLVHTLSRMNVLGGHNRSPTESRFYARSILGKPFFQKVTQPIKIFARGERFVKFFDEV